MLVPADARIDDICVQCCPNILLLVWLH